MDVMADSQTNPRFCAYRMVLQAGLVNTNPTHLQQQLCKRKFLIIEIPH